MATSEDILLELLQQDKQRREAARQLLTTPPEPVVLTPPKPVVRTPGGSPLQRQAPSTVTALRPPPEPVTTTPEQHDAALKSMGRASERRREDLEMAARSEEAGLIRSHVGAFTGGFGDVLAGVPEGLESLITAPYEAAFGDLDTAPEDRPGRRLGEYIRRGFQGPINPDYAEDFSIKVAQGFGSAGGFVAGALLGRGIGLFKGAATARGAGLTGAVAKDVAQRTGHKFGRATAGIIGSLTIGSESIKDAERNGAEGMERFGAFLGGMALGATEMLTMGAMLNRLDHGSGGFVSKFMADSAKKNIFVQASSQALEEAIQEFVQNAGTNALAKALFDADRIILDQGVVEGSQVGGIVGFTLGAIMTALGGRHANRTLGGLDMPPSGPAGRAEAAASSGTPVVPVRPDAEAVSAESLFGDPEAAAQAEAEAEAAALIPVGPAAVLAQRKKDLEADLERAKGMTDPSARVAINAELRRVNAEITGKKPTKRTAKERKTLAGTPLVSDTADVVLRKLGGLDTQIENDFSGSFKDTPLSGPKNVYGIMLSGLEKPGSTLTLETVQETFLELGFIREGGEIDLIDQTRAILDRIVAGEAVRNPLSPTTEADLEAEATARQAELEAAEAAIPDVTEAQSIKQLTEQVAKLDEGEAERISKLDISDSERSIRLRDAIERLTPAQGELDVEPTTETKPGDEPVGVAETEREPLSTEPEGEPAAGGDIDTGTEPTTEPVAEPAAGELDEGTAGAALTQDEIKTQLGGLADDLDELEQGEVPARFGSNFEAIADADIPAMVETTKAQIQDEIKALQSQLTAPAAEPEADTGPEVTTDPDTGRRTYQDRPTSSSPFTTFTEFGSLTDDEQQIVGDFQEGFYGKKSRDTDVNTANPTLDELLAPIKPSDPSLTGSGPDVIVEAYRDSQDSRPLSEERKAEFRAAIEKTRARGGFKEGSLGSRHTYLEARWFFEKGKKREVSWENVSAVVKSLGLDITAGEGVALKTPPGEATERSDTAKKAHKLRLQLPTVKNKDGNFVILKTTDARLDRIGKNLAQEPDLIENDPFDSELLTITISPTRTLNFRIFNDELHLESVDRSGLGKGGTGVNQPKSTKPSHLDEALADLDTFLKSTRRATAERQSAVEQRKEDDDASAVQNASKDVRYSILNSPAKLQKLDGLDQDEFTKLARTLVDEYLEAEQAAAITSGDSSRLIGLDTVAGEDFFDDLFFASLRVEVAKRADREQKEKKTRKKAETERGKKFGNTGVTLRRFWEQQSRLAEKADGSTVERLAADITTATQRAELFPVERLAKGGTPGLKRYMELLRSYITPFKKWANKNSDAFRSWQNFDENMNTVFGDDEKVATLRADAVTYIKIVTDFAAAIDGAANIEEAAALMRSALRTTDNENTELGKRVTGLGDNTRYIHGLYIERYTEEEASRFRQREVGQIKSYKMARLIEEEAKPDEEVKGVRAKSMLRFARPVQDLHRENRVDIRKGKDVPPVAVKIDFGFADIVIGGYVTPTQEKLHGNKSFDAFHDLATIMGIQPKDISQGGKLYYTIGALGHGKWKAHYNRNQVGQFGEGSVQVINLTRDQGDGSVAHEWGHSLDYNLRDSVSSYGMHPAISDLVSQLTYDFGIEKSEKDILPTVNSLLDGKSSYRGVGRQKPIDHAKRYLDIMISQMERGGGNHLRRTDFYSQARNHSGNPDYWASDTELFARAFESWVYDELKNDNDSSNEYLVDSFTEDGKVKSPPYKFAPYPQGDERARFARLFEIIRDNLVYTKKGPTLKKGTFEKLEKYRSPMLVRLKELRANLPTYIEERAIEAKDKKRTKELELRAQAQKKADETAAAVEEALQGEKNDLADVKASEMHTLSDTDLDDLLADVQAEVAEMKADEGHTNTAQAEASPESSNDEETLGKPDPILAGTAKLVKRLQQVFNRSETLNNPAFFRLADEAFGGTRAEATYTTKDAYDAMELAVNVQMRTLFEQADVPYENAAEWVPFLNDFTARLPTQANRTEEQIEFQQFSTPPPLAYIAGWVANMNQNDQVLEPSAGTGSLVVQAQSQGASVIANELSLRRNTLLATLGLNPKTEDAEFINAHIQGDEAPSVVLMNPPFSAAPDRGVGNKTMRGAKHVENALKTLRPGGRLVAIVGKGMERGKATFDKWWRDIDGQYNVRAAVRVSGNEYRKFGTTFDSVILVIDKPTTPVVTPPTDTKKIVTGRVENVAALVSKLQRIRDGRLKLSQPTPRQQAIESGTIEVGGTDRTEDGTRSTTDQTDVGKRKARSDQSGTSVEPDGDTGRSGKRTKPRADDGDIGSERRRANDQSDDAERTKGSVGEGTGVSPDTAPAGGDTAGRTDVSVDQEIGELAAELAKEGISLADNVLKGLVEIFGGDKLKSFPAGFDEDSYQRAKPLFIAARKDAIAMVGTAKNLFRALVAKFGDGILPYLKRFGQDVREEEKRQAPATPPSPDPNTLDGMDNSPTDKRKAPAKPAELTDSLWEGYEVKHTIPGAQPHPANIVESAAMTQMELPDTDYKVDLPEEQVKSGAISEVQIEPVIAGGFAHSQMLPSDVLNVDEKRRGFLLGDGTGLGKTRSLIGFILDNRAKGRPLTIFVGNNTRFLNDFRKNWESMGQDKRLIKPAADTKVNDDLTLRKGVIYITYDMLGRTMSESQQEPAITFKKGDKVATRHALIMDGQEVPAGTRGVVTKGTGKTKVLDIDFGRFGKTEGVTNQTIDHLDPKKLIKPRSRNEQILHHVGNKFDGLLIFDEAHYMANAIDLKGKRGTTEASFRARAGIALVDNMPNARVVYSTATAATEVHNLAYMDRLGLWGRGTSFADVADFIEKINKGGLLAMEFVAQNMKSFGVFLSRRISWDDVGRTKIVHKTTPEQKAMYDELVTAWQTILANIDKAMQSDVTGQADDKTAKRQINNKIWSFQQRFFNQIITTLKMPTILEKADAAIARGEAVLFQLVNTNDAQIKRAAAKGKAEGISDADLDLTPKQDVIKLVEETFPTDQWVDDTDARGNKIKKPLLGSDGKPVQNPEAIAMKKQLIQNLNDIRIPLGPLDILINHWGPDKIAEVSSRAKRPIVDPITGEVTLEPVPGQQAEIDAFQDDSKQLLAFTGAGNTSASYHADLERLNQRKRNHFLVQPGWRADGVIQGLGRGHRANQAQAPDLFLMTSDIQAEMRFVSSIAKRIEQMGSLTTGSRETGGQGMFAPEDNLETEYAEAAVKSMFKAIALGDVEGISIEDLRVEMGLSGLVDPITGEVADTALPDVRKFLNRLLSVKLDRMNLYYDHFFERLSANVEAAIASGDYDAGLENLNAEQIDNVHEEVVYTEPKSGAETKYVKLELTDPIRYHSFKDIAEMGINTRKALMFFAKNNRSGNLYAFFEANDFHDEHGRTRERYRRVGISGAGQLVDQKSHRIEVRNFNKPNYTEIPVAEAAASWQETIEAAPANRTWIEHIITGNLLQIWDRLIGKARAFRVITSDGERMIGRGIANQDLVSTLNNLGADGAKITASHKQIHDRVLNSDFTYRLSNRWTIKRANVNQEKRIELLGLGFGSAEIDQVKDDGVFTEVISSRTRYFIPTDLVKGVKVLDKLLQFRDISEEIQPGPVVEAERTGTYQMRDDGNAETRQMGVELNEINAHAAAGAAQRTPEIETLATAINTEFLQDQTTSLIGKTVNTVEDLAALSQVYRDPRYETLRYFLTNDAGQVLYQTAVSARMPGATAAFAVGQNVSDLGADIRKTTGARHLWMVHNHPSGNSEPSGADMETTREISQELRELGINVSVDHVVINSNEYSVLQALPDGKRTQVMLKSRVKRNYGRDRLLEAALPHPTLGKEMTGPADVSDVAAALHKGAGWITVVGLNPDNTVRAIGEVHESILNDSMLLKRQLRGFARATGATDLYVYGVNEARMFEGASSLAMKRKATKWAANLVEQGYVKDIIGIDRQSLTVRDESLTSPIDVHLGFDLRQVTKVIKAPSTGKYESEATKAQERTVEKVRKGQPLDRIMRTMFVWTFKIFGLDVLNEKGEFKGGIIALNRVKKVLTEAKFSDTSPFRWANSYMEHARMGLIDRYGVPQDFIQLGFETLAAQRRLLREGLEFLNRLFEAGVTTLNEAVVIHKMLTGEDLDGNEAIISTEEWESLAAEIRAAIDVLGLEAVELNLISRESYERNKGTYLHRVYTEHELGPDKTLSRFMGGLMSGRKHVIKGDELRGRGIFQEVTQPRLLKDISKPDAEEFFGIKKRKGGKPDATLLTKKFRILDLFDEGPGVGSQTIPGVEDTPTPKKLKRRMFVPADAPVPAKLGNYEDRGVFSVRRISGNKLVLWRDFSKAERVQMGEILDARYTIAKTYHVMAQDLSSARFFRDISQNKEWTWHGETAPPDEIVAKHNSALRHYVGYEWVLVPSDNISGKTKVKKWGALAGKHIRAEIWKDLNELDAMNTTGPWSWLLKHWKLNKTARHPVVHMNNVVSNLSLMDLIDIRARDLYRGIKEYNERGEFYEMAREHGAFGASYIDQEIKDQILKPVLADMSKEAQQGLYEEGSFLNKLRFVDQYSRFASEGIQRLGKAIQNFDRASIEWYRTEDEVFRMAIFIRRMELGDTVTEAAALAREQMLNYDIRAPWVNTARRSVLPFIAYTYRAVPAIIDAMARRPWKMAKYALIAEMANALSYAVTDGDEEWERASLRPEVRGNVWLGAAPRMMRMPADDKHGNPIFLDIRRWIPAGDVFDTAPNNPLPIPSWLHFGGPIMIAAEFMLNKQAFTGGPIVDPLVDTLGDKTKKYGQWAYRSLMPSAPWVPDSWYWNKIGTAFSGGRDSLGRDITVPSALLSSAGVKAAGHDVELNFEYRRREFDRTERALKYALNLNRRDMLRKLISPKEGKKIETDLLEKMIRLNENRIKTFAPALNRRQ